MCVSRLRFAFIWGTRRPGLTYHSRSFCFFDCALNSLLDLRTDPLRLSGCVKCHSSGHQSRPTVPHHYHPRRTTGPRNSPSTSGARTAPATRSATATTTPVTRPSANTAATMTPFSDRSTAALALFAFVVVRPPHQLNIRYE